MTNIFHLIKIWRGTSPSPYSIISRTALPRSSRQCTSGTPARCQPAGNPRRSRRGSSTVPPSPDRRPAPARRHRCGRHP